MRAPERRPRRRRHAAALTLAALVAALLAGSAAGDKVTALHNKLGSAQAQLNSNKAREQTLEDRITALDSQVLALAQQISLVRSRELDVRRQLAGDRRRLAANMIALTRERRRLVRLHHVLGRARAALAAELVGQYEQPQQSIVSLLVDATSFQQLLDSLQYLANAKQQEQSIITVTRNARNQAQAAKTRLAALHDADATATRAATTQNAALAGMNSLLSSRESALAHERVAQSTALGASQLRGAKLEAAVSSMQKQENQAEAVQRALEVSYSVSGSAGLLGGWAIPLPIVLCESGGQNLPPNGAGASGYYQIIPSTWREFGGTGSAAYLAPKPEQDAVATKIWNNGAGASDWTCARILGIS